MNYRRFSGVSCGSFVAYGELPAVRWNIAASVILVKIQALLAVWISAWLKFLEPDHGSPTTSAKNAARIALEAEVRLIYNNHIHFSLEVTAGNRKTMKLPPLGVPFISGLQGEVDCAVDYALRRIDGPPFPLTV
jgi:hypothetical protein